MDDITKIVIETEQRSKSNTHRIDVLENKVEDYGAVITTIQVMAERMNRMDVDMKEVKADVKTLLDKPAKRWEGVVRTVIETILGAAIIYLLAKAGIGA